ncbi:uncharacterized protein LOC110453837 [Mizuhopecten yessoensis]|uniref:Uncharacterized protein n=1 Tax=Mizuhopecten yessoensis TaxID=6573 RepID=A0A210QGH6_MIZYE|nr:uncharacterized protein LOC110453837 [Mizuhopecten yessoensis]OWF47852.1 hypothetical protein KP79_PYT22835 [Mizuhopecten yessoensis]
MKAALAIVLCFVCLIQVSVGQRFVMRNHESRFDPRFRRPAPSSIQGSALGMNEWGDPFSNLRSGLSREDRQMLRLLDLGSLGDRVISRNRNAGPGSRSWGRGSQIAIEFDSRGRSQSRSSSRGSTRFADSGLRGDSRSFRTSGGQSSSRSSFDSFSSRSSPDIIMISSRLPSSDRRGRTDNVGHFNDIGMPSSSQPVVVRARDQVLSRSEFIRSSRPSQDARLNTDPVSSSSRNIAPSASWQEMTVPQLNVGVDSFSNNHTPTTSIFRDQNPPTNTGTRSPDILIQTSAHVNPGGSNTMVSQSTTSTNVADRGSHTSVSNSHIVSAQSPASSALQDILMSLAESIDIRDPRFPRPTEEPLELEEMLMRKLMARV